ncbi:hypothetical protein [Micromonospora sp. NPDC051296]
MLGRTTAAGSRRGVRRAELELSQDSGTAWVWRDIDDLNQPVIRGGQS